MRQSKDFLDQIIEYESGELNDKEIIEMFSEMIQDGTVWQLPFDACCQVAFRSSILN